MKIKEKQNALSYDIEDFITDLELKQNEHPLQKINLFRAKTEILYLKLKEYFGVEVWNPSS